MDIFSIRLKELRLEKEMTQKKLAKELETSDDSIYSWETGRSQPSIEMIRAICKYFNVSSDYLLGLE
jgi:DNA-binding XRE family transcriptional regulator